MVFYYLTTIRIQTPLYNIVGNLVYVTTDVIFGLLSGLTLVVDFVSTAGRGRRPAPREETYGRDYDELVTGR